MRIRYEFKDIVVRTASITEYCMGIHKETLGNKMNKVLLQSITPINNSKGNEMN